MPKLYIDADALPNILKPILVRAINRLSLDTIIVSNKKVHIGESKFIHSIIVDAGADEADNKIVDLMEKGDIVITADIPLADRIVTKEGYAIDHRGESYTVHNIKQYLAMRNLMQSIRDSGEMTKGPAPFTQKDAQKFANQLNALLQSLKS